MHQTIIPEAEDPAFGIIRPEYRKMAATVAHSTGLYPTQGNQVGIIPVNTDRLHWMLEQLQQARKSIYIDMYRFRVDSGGVLLYSILEEKARAGLDVRIIVDKGANKKEDLDKLKLLQDTGAQVEFFRFPVWVADYILPPIATTHRDHRKIVIIDGEIAYIGGRNLADYYYFVWKDLDACYSGPVVAQLAQVYQENWNRVSPDTPSVSLKPAGDAIGRIPPPESVPYFSGKTIQIIPDSPIDKRLPLRDAFELAVEQARDYFYFQSPYLPPPPSTVQKLKEAALRGVDVRWMVPSKNDIFFQQWMGETLYKGYMTSGIRVFEWQEEMLHNKLYISDDYITCIGSTNVDNLSFFLNYEVSSIIYDEEVACSTKEQFLKEQEQCREITLSEVEGWNAFRLLRNWFFRVLGGPVG
jgi:cardiolipin synthase